MAITTLEMTIAVNYCVKQSTKQTCNFLLMFSRRGSLLSTAIFVYAATAPVNGYFGGSLYARMGGE